MVTKAETSTNMSTPKLKAKAAPESDPETSLLICLSPDQDEEASWGGQRRSETVSDPLRHMLHHRLNARRASLKPSRFHNGLLPSYTGVQLKRNTNE